MHRLIVISRRQRGSCIIWSPDCIFIVHVQKKKTCLYPPSLIFFVVEAEAMQQTNTIVPSLICAVKDVLSYFFFLVWVICSPSGAAAKQFSVIDWLQQSISDWTFVFGVVKIALGKIFPSVHLRPKALSIKAVHLNLLPSYKSLIMHRIYCWSQ